MQAILKITTSSTNFEDLANEELLPIVSSKERKKIIVFYLNIVYNTSYISSSFPFIYLFFFYSPRFNI